MNPLEKLAEEYGYTCIITTGIMIEPFTAITKAYPPVAVGERVSDLEKHNSFECAALHEWLVNKGHSTNPYDRSPLTISGCKLNETLQNEIESFIKDNQALDQEYADKYLAELQTAKNKRLEMNNRQPANNNRPPETWESTFENIRRYERGPQNNLPRALILETLRPSPNNPNLVFQTNTPTLTFNERNWFLYTINPRPGTETMTRLQNQSPRSFQIQLLRRLIESQQEPIQAPSQEHRPPFR